MITCRAAQCTVAAESAVSWLVGYSNRMEPICFGHRLALAEFCKQRPRETYAASVLWLPLARYVQHQQLRADPSTATITADDFASFFR